MQHNKTWFYILVVVFSWFTVVYFPGSYSVDSWFQLDQAINWNFTDWHNPFYSVLWKLLMLPTGQFFSMYLFQMVLFSYFVYLLLVVINNKQLAFWLGLLIAAFYMFIPQYVMKDALHAILWALASVWFIIHAQRQQPPKRSSAVIMLLLLIAGLLTRLNAIIGIFPLLWAWAIVYLPGMKGFIRRGIVVLVIAVLGFAANSVLTYNILHAQKAYPQYKVMLLDVIGISKLTGKNYLPDCFASYANYNKDSVISLYKPYTIDHIYWPEDMSAPMIPEASDKYYPCLSASWKKALAENPVTYVRNRLEGYLYYLRLKTRTFKDGTYWDAGPWIQPGHKYSESRFNPEYVRKLAGPYYGVNGTVMFAPWLFLLLNIAGAIYFFVRYRQLKEKVYIALTHIQLSGVMYLLSFFVVFQNDRDFRFNYWNVLVAFIGLICILQEGKRKRKEEPATP